MTIPNITDIKRISKVFQGLVDFVGDHRQSSEGITVPEHIQTLVLNLRVAHEAFEEGIEKYMHTKKDDLSKVKTVERIIEECPYYLTVKDKEGHLPILNAACYESSFPTLIPLLAKAGVQYGVGGEGGRGGLLVENDARVIALNSLTFHGHVDAMQALLNAEPPLLIKSDIVKYELIHEAAAGNKMDMMKMMIEMDPAALYGIGSSAGELPIHFTKSVDAFRLLLKSAVEYDPKHSSIGGLFAKDIDGDMPIHEIIKKVGTEGVFTCIGQALCTHKDVPVLHKAILHTPEYVHDIITTFPDSCFLRDENGRLPIHVALETGMKWSSELSSIMNANSEHLDEVDPVTKLCMGALAAVKPTCGLRTINYLMLKHPKNAKVTASCSDQEQCKRRKLNH